MDGSGGLRDGVVVQAGVQACVQLRACGPAQAWDCANFETAVVDQGVTVPPLLGALEQQVFGAGLAFA